MLAAALLAVPLLAGCSDDETQPSPGPHGAPKWERLPDLPLTKRFGPVVANVQGKIVVVGGDTGPQCPSSASCITTPVAARDGAALDPLTERWKPIAPAPVDLQAFTPSAVVGDDLFVLQNGTLLDYDASADRWRALPRVSRWYDLVSAGDRLVLVLSSDEDPSTRGAKDLIYDIARDRWSALPADPLGPMFGRTITTTDEGFVLSGQPLSASPQPTDPLYAAEYDEKTGDWTRLPDRKQSDPNDAPLPGEDEWAIEQADDRSRSENLQRPAGAPERVGPVAWIGGTVYVIGGAGFHDGTTVDYDVRVWRINTHPAYY